VPGLPAGAEATTFPLPETGALPEELTPLLAVIPMQLLALRMAEARGLNPDTFRRDDPVYRDALGLIKL
jgi:glucosamine 6-phosphate synthetase-like amidotransferase/phosphosugar isomerase protein